MPLNVKINPVLGYTSIIFKGDFTLPDYEPFARDARNQNTASIKRFDSVEISQLKLELESICNQINK